MKLKPSLLQLITLLMMSSLMASFLAACTTNPSATNLNCNDPAVRQANRECTNSSNGSSRTYVGGGSGVYTSGSSSTLRQVPATTGSKGSSVGSSSHSSSSSGRGGFGSFGRWGGMG
ncbi:hypothetical protein [Trichocoleus sp. FACHB-262]|uniref:hypothetical protein n=1 Tax=Trichocoleus sp. FACHB-262 TaxID=2692869 RepID=UPI00168484E7|nr:hypothetical protein [Trichocoleus sp. FACHB-262]MBD2121713.1 hypothetical protein [Trichocoleus sp. FACHB-262]